MREQNCRNARQPACAHRRVLGVRSFVSKFVCRPLVYAKSPFVATSASVFVSFFSTNKGVVKLIVFLKFPLSSFYVSQHVCVKFLKSKVLSISCQVVVGLNSQNEIPKICRNEKFVFLFSCLSVFSRNAGKVLSF
jgi:hypothetical protein